MIRYNWEEKKQIPPVPHPSLFSSFPASHFLAVIERRETAPFPFAHFCPSEKWATSRQLFMPRSYALCGWLGVENQLLTSHYCVCFVSDASEYALLFLNFHKSFCSDGALNWLPHSSTSLTRQCGVELDCGPWGAVISCVKSPLLTGVDVVCILWKSSLMLTYLFSRTFRGPISPPGASMSGRLLSHLIHQRAAEWASGQGPLDDVGGGPRPPIFPQWVPGQGLCDAGNCLLFLLSSSVVFWSGQMIVVLEISLSLSLSLFT